MDNLYPACLMNAWLNYEIELRRYLRHRLADWDDADDVLHDVLIKLLQQGRRFCAIKQPRAWLFQVARNTLVDRQRAHRIYLPLSDELPAISLKDHAPLELLSQCLPRVLTELSAIDQLLLTRCDLEGLQQSTLAAQLGLSLPAIKSRIQRARIRLQKRLIAGCQVRFNAAGQICCFTPRD